MLLSNAASEAEVYARDHHLSHQSSADDGQFAGSDAAGDLRFSMGSLAGSNLRDSISTQAASEAEVYAHRKRGPKWWRLRLAEYERDRPPDVYQAGPVAKSLSSVRPCPSLQTRMCLKRRKAQRSVPDQASHNAQRLSVTTTRSAAPSFFSGTSEFAATGMDAPMMKRRKAQRSE
jgi:hypothetical protein